MVEIAGAFGDLLYLAGFVGVVEVGEVVPEREGEPCGSAEEEEGEGEPAWQTGVGRHDGADHGCRARRVQGEFRGVAGEERWC